MKLSFSTRGWMDMHWEEMLDEAREMGFAGVEIYNVFFPGDGGERQQIVVLVVRLDRAVLLVPFADEVILAGIDQHIPGEQRFGIISGNSGAKTVVCGFDVAVARVHGNDHFVLIQFHVLIKSFL